MIFEQLSIINFKNIQGQTLHFAERFNCFTGANGSGKTNSLDAIHFLSTCRSIASMSDSALIRHQSDFFMLEGRYIKGGVAHKVSCGCKKGQSKSLKLNDKEYGRLSNHIGEFPVVLVSPLDTVIINESADERRRYINLFLSQIDREYLSALIGYNTILKERNAMLKSGTRGELLEVMDMQLGRYADIIFGKRTQFIEELLPIAQSYYREISSDKESFELRYRSQLIDSSMEQLLEQSREKDMVMGHTTVGVHRDDIVMSLDGHPIRKYGSQGQQKSFLIALKLAQSELIVKHKGIKPLLLLDDIFDKLDFSRVESLMELVSDSSFGQIFITDSNKIRMDKVLSKIAGEHKLFNVAAGEIL